jgi:tetratricopeptide (TPR) repeat protein
MDPQFAQAFSMRALVTLALKDYVTAANDAERAVSLDPLDENAYAALATACNSLQQFENAQKASNRTLAMNPDFWQARLEMAKSLYGLGQFVLALRELDLLDQDFADIHLVRGNVLMRLERQQEAAKEFNVFMRQAPSDPRSRQIERILAIARPASLANEFSQGIR